MKKLGIVFLLLGISLLGNAQYKFAVGLRSGGTTGVTLKSNTSSTSAIEGIFGFWGSGISATGLYEKRQNAFDVAGMYWYYGYGVHVSVYESKFNGNFNPYWGERYEPDPGVNAVGLGLDGITGLEYKIPEIPLSVHIEVKPFLEFTTTGNVWLSFDPGLGLRLVF